MVMVRCEATNLHGHAKIVGHVICTKPFVVFSSRITASSGEIKPEQILSG